MRYIFTIFFFSVTLLAKSQIYFVDQNAVGGNSGTSWENAWTDLQTALQNTSTGEIWVKEGIYKATVGADRNISFELNSNVNLYGGFPQIGNPTWEQRDWITYQTILSGDIGVENDTSDNTFHIMTLRSWDSFDNVIDGFVFTQANSDYKAGGISISGLFNFDSRATIRNCIFRENYAGYEGAAISASWTSLIIKNCVFENNYAGYEGGAISYFSDHFSTDVISLLCENSIFRNNIADYSGGAVSTRGYNNWYNCLFQNNSANYEGGVFSHFRDGLVNVVNCTFVENHSGGDGSVLDIFSWTDTVQVGGLFSNCIFSGNTGRNLLSKGGKVDSVIVYHSFLEVCPLGIYCEDGNIFGVDPKFAGQNDFRLRGNSLCIDVGDNSYLPAEINTDLDGNSRIVNTRIDFGPYEYGASVSVDNKINSSFSVFPNPARHQLFIETNGLVIQYRLLDMYGRVIKSWDKTKSTIANINLEGLPDGFYIVHMYDGKKEYMEKVLIFNR